jgi:hypothetical protein
MPVEHRSIPELRELLKNAAPRPWKWDAGEENIQDANGKNAVWGYDMNLCVDRENEALLFAAVNGLEELLNDLDEAIVWSRPPAPEDAARWLKSLGWVVLSPQEAEDNGAVEVADLELNK